MNGSVTPLTLGRNGQAQAANMPNPGYNRSLSSSTAGGAGGSSLYNVGSRDSTGGMTPIRQGMVTVNEEKGIRSFLWSKKWMVLKEQSLSFHKNEVSVEGIRVMMESSAGGIRYLIVGGPRGPSIWAI
jgi:hypothetical protein